jgi:hypothetical protein
VSRGDGDAAAMPDPPRDTTGDARGRVASPACGREHRRREVQRGGAVDRGSTRTALTRARERPGPRLRPGALRGAREGCGKGRSWRFAVKRSSTWSAHPVSGTARLPSLAAAAHAQDGSVLGDALRREVQRGSGRSRESSEPQGARDGSRLQKSVRRIFPAANGAPEPETARRPRERGVARSDSPALDGAEQGSRRATGCGARRRA